MRNMLVVLVATFTLLGSGGNAETARAQGRPGDVVLVDEVFRMAPGGDLRQCIDVAELTKLTVFVSSPEGRTGETAVLNFSDDRQTVSPNVQLFVKAVPVDEVMSTHLAPPGSYCYYLRVSHNLVSTLPPDALEKPYKNIYLKIISTP